MQALVIAYLVGWAATSAYLGWIAMQNAQLVRRQQELKKLLLERDKATDFYSNAA